MAVLRKATALSFFSSGRIWEKAIAAGVALSGSVAGDAMAGAGEASEFLDVDMDHLAGSFALVAPDGLGRLEGLQAVEAVALEDAADGGGGEAGLGGDPGPGEAQAAQDDDAFADRRRRRSV